MKLEDNSRKRLILKIVSVFVAVIIWIFITYTDDSQIDVTINSIDVQLTGESYLNDHGYMVINRTSIPKASVTVRGKRSDIIGVMDSITASVDVSGVSDSGEFKLKPTFDIPSNAVYISKRKTTSIEVDIEKIEEKTIDVRVVQNNSEQNDSYIIESVPDKKSIKIRGEKKDIDSIDHAAVYVDVKDITEDNSVTGTLIFESGDGSEIICANKLFYDSEKMQVKNKAYEKRELPINITVPFDLNKKYSAELIKQEVDKVWVGIKDESGKSVSEITNEPYSGELEVGTKEYEFYLDAPDGIYLPEDKRRVKAELEVFEKTEKLVTIPVTVHNSKNRVYELSKQEVGIWVSGPEEKLQSNYFKAELNLDSYDPSEEEQNVTVRITSDERDVGFETKEVQIRALIK